MKSLTDAENAQPKGVVIYDSRFGNTKKIAESLELGLQECGIHTVCLSTKDIVIDYLKEYDLICVGAPTEKFGASDAIKEFLAKLRYVDLSGKKMFAFDTKVSPGIFGSAAKYIEKELKLSGLEIFASHESAIVSTSRQAGEISGARLREGEDEKFREIGREIGKSLAATKRREIPA